KIPFLATYGAFASCRAADQIRVTVAYSNLNVKIGGAHGGISVGPDGATHQAMEEISIIRSIPNMSMIVPCDYWETYKATLAAAKHVGPVYLRFGREDVPVVTGKDTPVPVELVAVHDRFGQSGKPAELMDAFGLRAKDIVEAAHRVLARKRGG